MSKCLNCTDDKKKEQGKMKKSILDLAGAGREAQKHKKKAELAQVLIDSCYHSTSHPMKKEENKEKQKNLNFRQKKLKVKEENKENPIEPKEAPKDTSEQPDKKSIKSKTVSDKVSMKSTRIEALKNDTEGTDEPDASEDRNYNVVGEADENKEEIYFSLPIKNQIEALFVRFDWEDFRARMFRANYIEKISEFLVNFSNCFSSLEKFELVH